MVETHHFVSYLPNLTIMSSPTPALATYQQFLADESATQALAQQLAQVIQPLQSSAHLYLKGDLGAGKTAFTRAFLRSLGVTGRIKSPSYALLENYKVSNLNLYHLDFYRFNDPEEWVEAGFRDILEEKAVVLIEWPEKAGGLLPPPDLTVHLEYQGEGRDLTITAYSKKGQAWLNTLTQSI